MNKKIAILGLGWVGQPLAVQLIEQGCTVSGTTRTHEKAEQLTTLGISTQILTLSSDSNNFSPFDIAAFDTLVIAITPGFKRGQTDYADNVGIMVKHAEQQQVKQVILLSSTGVYTELAGEINEQSTLNLNNTKACMLSRAEQRVMEFNGNSQVLRLAGLVGPERYPGTFLAGKSNLAGGNARVHLIHRQDVINIIVEFIKQPKQQGIYNCVSPTKATRERFYQKAALNKGLISPTFTDNESEDVDKTINGDKLQQVLAYTYRYPDLYQWLDEAKG